MTDREKSEPYFMRSYVSLFSIVNILCVINAQLQIIVKRFIFNITAYKVTAKRFQGRLEGNFTLTNMI